MRLLADIACIMSIGWPRCNDENYDMEI